MKSENAPDSSDKPRAAGSYGGKKRPAAAAVETLTALVEVEDRLPRQPVQWLALMVVAAVVGGLAGVVGAAFRLVLQWADEVRLDLVTFSDAHLPRAAAWVIPVCVCALAAGIALWLTQRFSPHTAGSGIPRIEAVLRAHLRPAENLILPVKFVGGSLSIGSGMALGREGPTVQMGGTIGRMASDMMHRFIPEPWTLMAAGAGAGLAVAFNAPLAAALFVSEELLHRFSPRVFSATLIACIVGTVFSRAILGQQTDFTVKALHEFSPVVLPQYLVLGLAAGALGVAFNISLVAALRLFGRTRRWPKGSAAAVVGAAVGILLWCKPSFVGGGEVLAQRAIVDPLPAGALVAYLLVRFFLTMGSYGCGAPGGIFAPLLALGALLGNLFAGISAALVHSPFDPAPYAIVAMAALFTAIVRSPLTGVVLLLEMTGSWTLILPMMAASLTAYIVPELVGTPPIYDALRELDEKREAETKHKKDR